MADIERISPQQAHANVKSNRALLVCAYEDDAKCRMLNLEGSTHPNRRNVYFVFAFHRQDFKD